MDHPEHRTPSDHRPPQGSRRDPDPELPVDSDVEVEESPGGPARPAHLRASLIGLVVLGGVVGTGLRTLVGLLVPRLGEVPVATVTVNLVGAFLLGLLLETLTRGGPDAGRRRGLRLLLGTGLLGGFTTYSALSVDTVQLGPLSPPALGYLATTLVLGAAASLAGIAVASRRGTAGGGAR